MLSKIFSERREELITASLLTVVYIAFFSGHYYSIDGMVIFQQAQSIYDNHSLVFNQPIKWSLQILVSKYGIGTSLLYLPGIALFSSWLRPYMYHPHGNVDIGRLYLDPLYTVAGAPVHLIITVATAYLIGRFCRRLNIGSVGVFWSMIFFGIGSPAFIYARGDFSQPLISLCWIMALYAAFRFRQTSSLKLAAWCAIAVGFGTLTRLVDGLIILPFTLVLFLAPPIVRRYSVRKLQAIGLVILGTSIALIINLLVNYGRYGNWLTTGYENEGWTTPLWIGLSGLLISAREGLLWAFPSVVLIPFGIRRLWRQDRSMVYALLLPALGLILLMGAWWCWWGGWNWGPRLILPTLSLFAVLAGAGIVSISRRNRTKIALILLGAGLFWALPGVTVDLNSSNIKYFNDSASNFQLEKYPVFSAWNSVDHWFATSATDNTGIDIFWFRFASLTKGASLIPFFICIIAALLLILKLFRIYNYEKDKPVDVF